MAWFNRKDKSAPAAEKKSMTLGTSESLGSFLMYGNTNKATTPASALQLYRTSSAVSIPINRIVTAIAGLKVVLEQEDGTIINKHPVLDLIRNPTPYYSQSLFMETIASNYLITGEFQVAAIGGISRPPIELQPLSPDNITVVEGNDGLPASLIVSGNSMAGQYASMRKGNQVRYIRDELTEVHMTRNFKTRNNSLLRGESLLLSASSEVRQHVLGGEHNASLLENGGRISLIFHFAEDLSPDDFEVTKQRVRDQYSGVSKAGKIGVTAGDGSLDIKEIGTKNKDMDFAKLQQMAKIAVANQYGFPLVLLDTDAATFNNYSTAKEALYDDAALPFAYTVFNGLSNFLLPRFNEDPKRMRLVPDLDSIPALATRRNKELKARMDIGIETHNELRKFLPNRQDIDGGNVVYIAGNNVPLGTTLVQPMDENPGIDAGIEDDDK